MSTLSGAETARKRFLLWEMGFPDAKISTRSRRAGRRERFYCERAEALSRSPGGLKGEIPARLQGDSEVVGASFECLLNVYEASARFSS